MGLILESERDHGEYRIKGAWVSGVLKCIFHKFTVSVREVQFAWRSRGDVMSDDIADLFAERLSSGLVMSVYVQ